MAVTIIGIAGGSGSGKSTLAVGLCRAHPEQYALIHLDDYFKKKAEVSLYNGMTNWEDPASIRFDDLCNDIADLKAGKAITILTKSEWYHPDYDAQSNNKKEQRIDPKPTIIIEGYLALYNEKLRNMMDKTIYLDIPIEISGNRRSGNKVAIDETYYHEVLLPMHARYVAPTRAYADLVIAVATMHPDDVQRQVMAYLTA